MSSEDSEDSDRSVPSPILLSQPIRPVLLGNPHRIASSADSASVSSHGVFTSEEENSLMGTDDGSYQPSHSETNSTHSTVRSTQSVIYTTDENSVSLQMSNSPQMSMSPSLQDNDSVAEIIDDAMNSTPNDDTADSIGGDSIADQIRQIHSDESAEGDFSDHVSISGHLTDESSRQGAGSERASEELSDEVLTPEPILPALLGPAENNPVQEPDVQLNEAADNNLASAEGTNNQAHGPNTVAETPPSSTSGIQQEAPPNVIPVIQLDDSEHIVVPPENEAGLHENPIVQANPILQVPSTSRQADQESSSPPSNAPPCKRQRLSVEDSPTKKVEAKTADLDDDDDEGTLCSICLDQWTSSGEHRIVSLKCGHLFGFSCIEKWVKNSKPAERKCPTCKAKARIPDIRNLYGHKIKMLDTTELESLRVKNKDLEREKEELIKEVNYVRKMNEDLTVKQRAAQMLIQQLKAEKLVSQRPLKVAASSSLFRYRMQLVHTLELSKSEGCRVSAFNQHRNVLVASVPSPTSLFQGFSLKMIDAESFKPRHTMPSHNKMIRDVAFSNDGKFLLSCGLDKVANVLCMDSNTAVTQFTTEMPLWSVSWDADNPWVLFTGGLNGVVQQFDIRSPGQEMSRLTTQGDMTPVSSLVSIPKDSSLGWLYGGLISCRLRQLYPYKRLSKDSFDVEPCPIEGTFCSMKYDRSTEHLLVSTRPTQRAPRAQHMTYQMSSDGRAPSFNLIQTFLGSTTQGVISRSCLLPTFNQQGGRDDMIVAAYVESESQVAMWSVSSGLKVQSVPSLETVMDLCPIHVNGNTYLSTLGDKKLRVYKVDRS